jgi:hypothetical protein
MKEEVFPYSSSSFSPSTSFSFPYFFFSLPPKPPLNSLSTVLVFG